MIKNNKKMTVILPAAGAGRRMKSYGPKCLIDLTPNQTILDRQLEIINNTFKRTEIVLVYGFESEKVIQKAHEECIKVENELYEDTNVARSVAMALRATTAKDILKVNGDLVFSREILKHIDYSSSCTICSKDPERESEVGCIIDQQGNLSHIMYDLEKKWSQIVYLKGKELILFKKHIWDTSYRKYFMVEIINKVIETGGAIKCREVSGEKTMDVDKSNDVVSAKDIE